MMVHSDWTRTVRVRAEGTHKRTGEPVVRVVDLSVSSPVGAMFVGQGKATEVTVTCPSGVVTYTEA